MIKSFAIASFVSLLAAVPSALQAQCAFSTNQTATVTETCGTVGIGTTTPATDLNVVTTTTSTLRGVTADQYSNDANAALLNLRKSRGTPSAPAALVTGDILGNVITYGYDGQGFTSGARLRFVVDGSPSAGSVPTAMQFFTGTANNGIERMRVTSAGNVGINTTAPTYKLHIVSAANGTADGIRVAASDTATNGGYLVVNKNSGVGGAATLQSGDNSNSAPLQLNPSGGGVGIGLQNNPASSLQVGGNLGVGIVTSAGLPGMVQLTMGGASPTANRLTFGTDGTGWGFAISKNQGGTVTDLVTVHDFGNMEVVGNITASGTIYAKYQDVAEWVPARAQIEAGTVVVLDPTHENQVMSSAKAYDTAVAGVVSSSPGVVLGEEGSGKEKVATTGRVRIKVDATQSPIAIGDLLVTSDIPGTAMKSQPIDVGGAKIHRPGTVIGKALQPLASGRGEILVLLSLQ